MDKFNIDNLYIRFFNYTSSFLGLQSIFCDGGIDSALFAPFLDGSVILGAISRSVKDVVSGYAPLTTFRWVKKPGLFPLMGLRKLFLFYHLNR